MSMCFMLYIGLFIPVSVLLSLMVGGSGIVLSDFLSCVRQKETSAQRAHRRDVALKMRYCPYDPPFLSNAVGRMLSYCASYTFAMSETDICSTRTDNA